MFIKIRIEIPDKNCDKWRLLKSIFLLNIFHLRKICIITHFFCQTKTPFACKSTNASKIWPASCTYKWIGAESELYNKIWDGRVQAIVVTSAQKIFLQLNFRLQFTWSGPKSNITLAHICGGYQNSNLQFENPLKKNPLQFTASLFNFRLLKCYKSA